MQFSEYEKQAVETAKYPNVGRNFVYPTLGLVGEAGEVAEKIKNIARRERRCFRREKEEIKKRWETFYGIWPPFPENSDLHLKTLRKNIEKLASRRERGVLHGSGDNR